MFNIRKIRTIFSSNRAWIILITVYSIYKPAHEIILVSTVALQIYRSGDSLMKKMITNSDRSLVESNVHLYVGDKLESIMRNNLVIWGTTELRWLPHFLLGSCIFSSSMQLKFISNQYRGRETHCFVFTTFHIAYLVKTSLIVLRVNYSRDTPHEDLV